MIEGLGSRQTHPDGAEGASMVRRAAFPLSRTPASIEHSMKLLRLRPDGAGGVLGRPSVRASRMEALGAAQRGL